jgi:cytoskeletal protein RodZ
MALEGDLMKKVSAKNKRLSLQKKPAKKVKSLKKAVVKKVAKAKSTQKKPALKKAVKPVRAPSAKQAKPKTPVKNPAKPEKGQKQVEKAPVKKEAILLPSSYPEPDRKKIPIVRGRLLTAAGWIRLLKEDKSF